MKRSEWERFAQPDSAIRFLRSEDQPKGQKTAHLEEICDVKPIEGQLHQ